jgi:hypothetical protein
MPFSHTGLKSEIPLIFATSPGQIGAESDRLFTKNPGQFSPAGALVLGSNQLMGNAITKRRRSFHARFFTFLGTGAGSKAANAMQDRCFFFACGVFHLRGLPAFWPANSPPMA